MKSCRAAILCSALGAITTVLIAWGMALRPANVENLTTVMYTTAPEHVPPTPLRIYQERRAGFSLFVMMTDLNDRPNASGPAWDFDGVRGTLPPQWTLTPAARPDIVAAMDAFPNHVGGPFEYKQTAFDREVNPSWPAWLPDIPKSPMGLLAYGGRAAGWPWTTMRSRLRVDADDPEPRWSASWRIMPATTYQAPPVFSRDPQAGCVPLAPVPLQFAGAAAMWGAAWYLLLFASGQARRALRRRRGQCARCAYDLRATPAGAPCPECGTLALSLDRT